MACVLGDLALALGLRIAVMRVSCQAPDTMRQTHWVNGRSRTRNYADSHINPVNRGLAY